MSARALIAEAVSVRIGGRTVLHGVSAAVTPGTITAVVGPNGAGKSTLLRVLAGLSLPAAGKVRLGTEDLLSIPGARRGRAIAYLPQARTIEWPLRSEDVVGLGRRPHGRTLDRLDTDDQAAVARAMAATDVTHLAGRAVTSLSGGEQARVLIARALAQEAPVFIADEPTTALDPAHQLALAAELRRHAARGGTVIVAVHDLGFAARVATRVLVLLDGRILADAPPAEALAPEMLARAFGIVARLAEVDGVPVIAARGAITPRSEQADA